MGVDSDEIVAGLVRHARAVDAISMLVSAPPVPRPHRPDDPEATP